MTTTVNIEIDEKDLPIEGYMSAFPELAKRWTDAAHAMQSAVLWSMVKLGLNDSSERYHQFSRKHLRVGINIALRDQGSLVKLLIEKGVLTEEEYLTAIAIGMEEEQHAYEAEHGQRFE